MRILLLLMLIGLVACSEENDDVKDSKCYTFDERQCGGNEWIEDNTNVSLEEKRNSLGIFSISRYRSKIHIY